VTRSPNTSLTSVKLANGHDFGRSKDLLTSLN